MPLVLKILPYALIQYCHNFNENAYYNSLIFHERVEKNVSTQTTHVAYFSYLFTSLMQKPSWPPFIHMKFNGCYFLNNILQQSSMLGHAIRLLTYLFCQYYSYLLKALTYRLQIFSKNIRLIHTSLFMFKIENIVNVLNFISLFSINRHI